MKKTLIFSVLLCLAVSSQAAGIKWSAAGLTFGTTSLAESTDVTGYLIYLSSGTYAAPYEIKDNTTAENLASSIGTVVSTQNGVNKLKSLSGSFSFSYGTYSNGDKFGMLLAYNNAGTMYYNLSSDIYTLANIADDTSTGTAAKLTFTMTDGGKTGSLSSGGGWVAAAAVPEPATGALALAGIALLLKRRKAAKA